MIPFYLMQIDDDVEGMDFNALVDTPAHMKGFHAFNGKQPKIIKQYFNEEKRIVTGVAISADQPIYRIDEQIGEHYVVFKREDIQKIAIKMMANGYLHNVNEMHDLNKPLKDMILFESYFVNDDLTNIPSAFESQNLKAGTWIISYKVENDQAWEMIKSGSVQGFSIEGWFKKTPIKVKGQFTLKNKVKSKQNKMKKDGFFARVFGAKSVFGSAITTDGIEISWEGDLAEGIEAFITDEAGEQMLAPEGDHSWENEDGSMTVITIDGSGIITAIQNVEAEVSEDEQSSDESDASQDDLVEVEEAMKKIIADSDEKFAAIEKQNEELKSNVEKLEAQVKQLCTELDSYVDGGQKFNRKEKSNAKHWSDFSK